MGEDEKDSEKPSYIPMPVWCRVVEGPVPKAVAHASILDDNEGLGAVLSDGAKTEIRALERQTPDWQNGLADSVFGIMCSDLSGHNRSSPERDTRVLPKDFSYNKVRIFYTKTRASP
jgi:hypothetical protein